MSEIIVDNFAGGGGASAGIEAALGRPIDYAINHDPEAIAMHRANHPRTHHLCENLGYQIAMRELRACDYGGPSEPHREEKEQGCMIQRGGESNSTIGDETKGGLIVLERTTAGEPDGR